MGFAYLAIVVLAITATALIAKLAALRNVYPLDLALSMFAVSTIFGFLVLWPRLPVQLGGLAILIPAVAGAGGALAVLAFNSALGIGHFGYSNAIYRSSLVVPVLYSVMFLGARLKLTTIAGIVLIVAGIVLMSSSPSNPKTADKPESVRWVVLILAAFLLSGAPRIGQTLTNLHQSDYFLYLFLSYLAGTVVLLAGAGVKRGFRPASLTWGAGGAVASYAGVFCTLKALETLQPEVVFPISLSGPIVLGVLLSTGLLGERIRPSGWLGIITGITGICILAVWR